MLLYLLHFVIDRMFYVEITAHLEVHVGPMLAGDFTVHQNVFIPCLFHTNPAAW